MGNCCSTSQQHGTDIDGLHLDDRGVLDDVFSSSSASSSGSAAHLRHTKRKAVVAGVHAHDANVPTDALAVSTGSTYMDDHNRTTGTSLMGDVNSSSIGFPTNYSGSFSDGLFLEEAPSPTTAPSPTKAIAAGEARDFPNNSANAVPTPEDHTKSIAATLAVSNPLLPRHQHLERSFPPSFPMPQFDDLSDLDSIDPAYAEKLTERVRKIPALTHTERQIVIEAWMQNCSCDVDVCGCDLSPAGEW